MYVRRKVFSYSEPEEQLYSVDMTETEYALFSAYMAGYEEALFSSMYGYDYNMNDAHKASGKKGEEFRKWLNSSEGEAWVTKNGTKTPELSSHGTTNRSAGFDAEKGSKEYKNMKQQMHKEMKEMKDIKSASYVPSHNAGGKSAKKSAQVFYENPEKFKDVVRKADMKRWVGRNKKALALGAAGTAALGAGAGYYAYNR